MIRRFAVHSGVVRGLLLTAVAITATGGCGDSPPFGADGASSAIDGSTSDAKALPPSLALGGLFVTVVDQASEPVVNAKVATDPATETLVTDVFGTVLFSNLTPGFYSVTAVDGAGDASRMAVVITASNITQARMILRAVPIPPGTDGGGVDLGAPTVNPDAGSDAGDNGDVSVVLAAPTKDTNGINLSWTATPTTGITAYRVYRAAMNGGFQIINIINSATTTTYRDEAPTLGATYSYRVGAVLGPTREAQSNVQMITAGVFIAVDTQVTTMLADRTRPYLYAVDTVNNGLLFINTSNNMVEKTIFIGSRPQDLDINPAGTELYVANFGATELAVVNLDTREKTRALTVNTKAGTWEGNPYKVACTAGDSVAFTSQDQWQDVTLVTASTGATLDVSGSTFFYSPDLVASLDGTHLYVSGDALARFDIVNGKMTMADSLSVSTQISGHLSVTGDNKYLFVGNKKILTTNLKSTLGTFSDPIMLTNKDGSIAISAQHVFDGNTFGVLKTLPIGLTTSSPFGSPPPPLALSSDEATLYIYDQMTSRIYLYSLK